MRELYKKVSDWESLREEMEQGKAAVHEAKVYQNRAQVAERALEKSLSQAETLRADAKTAVEKARAL